MSTNNANSSKSSANAKKAPVKEVLAEEGLLSLEKLDRASPELWPEKIPGITGFIAMSDTPIRTPAAQWTQGLSQDDVNAMLLLSQQPVRVLANAIKNMQDESYQLGLIEAQEMTRGKYLGIFANRKKK